MNFLLNNDQDMIRTAVQKFVRQMVEPEAGRIDDEGVLPDDLIKKIAALNLPGMVLSKKFGGTGASLTDCVLAIEQVSYTGCGTWWYVAFSNSIPECIETFGTSEQKNRFLPGVSDGEIFPSIQFTEDISGSDPAMLQTTAHFKDAKYHINGSKRFSTFGRRPGFVIVYAQDSQMGCTAFILDKHCNGYSTGKPHQLMGSGGVEAVDVFLDDVVLGEENILGKPGSGFEILLHWIAIEKIQQCAACVGIAKAAMDEAIFWAKQRMVKGKPLIKQQWVQFSLAEMQAKLQAARTMTYRAAFLKDTEDKRWKTEAATAKVFVVPAAMEIVEESRRIHGAYGYAREYKIERLYRAVAGASAIAVSLEINKAMVAHSLA